jgi:hypothetical protein
MTATRLTNIANNIEIVVDGDTYSPCWGVTIKDSVIRFSGFKLERSSHLVVSYLVENPEDRQKVVTFYTHHWAEGNRNLVLKAMDGGYVQCALDMAARFNDGLDVVVRLPKTITAEGCWVVLEDGAPPMNDDEEYEVSV